MPRKKPMLKPKHKLKLRQMAKLKPKQPKMPNVKPMKKPKRKRRVRPKPSQKPKRRPKKPLPFLPLVFHQK
jgi:hypothetical protein